jgi:hypothetical protein
MKFFIIGKSVAMKVVEPTLIPQMLSFNCMVKNVSNADPMASK